MKIFKKEKLVVLLLFAALICAVYFQAALGGKSLLSTLYYPFPFCSNDEGGRKPVNSFNIDLGTPAFYEIPLNKLAGDLYKQGILPLWNPYQACGTPLAAQYSTRVFFPYQILEDLLPWWTWDYFILGRLIIAAFFTYLFLRLLHLSPPCAFLGGVLYSLSGTFTWFINLEQFTNAAMMLPVCLFSTERLLQRKKKQYLAECAGVYALMLLAGQPETAAYILLLISVYFIFRIGSERLTVLQSFNRLLKFSVIIALMLGLCAFLILPFVELASGAYQCHPPGGDMGIREPTSISVAISILIPSFSELPTYYRVFPHNGIWDWIGGYCGIAPVYLILLCLFLKGAALRKHFLFFALAGAAVILKNFGCPAIAWIGKLPLLDQVWSPRWAGPVWTFSLSCAAAIGAQICQETRNKKKLFPWIACCALLAGIVFLIGKTGYLPQLKGLPPDAQQIFLPPLLGGIFAGISILLSAHLLYLRTKNKDTLIYGLILLSIIELCFYLPRGADFPATVLKIIPFILGIAGAFLIAGQKQTSGMTAIVLSALSFIIIDMSSLHSLPARTNPFTAPGYVNFLRENTGCYRIAAGDGILMPNFAGVFKLQDIRYINSMTPAHYQHYVDKHLLQEGHLWFSDRLWFSGLPDTNKPNPRLFYQEIKDNFIYYSYLGVKFILAPSTVSLNLPIAYYDAHLKIYKNPNVFPRAYIAHNLKKASSFPEAQSLMQHCNLKETAIIEEAAPHWYNPESAAPTTQANIEQYTPQRITVSTVLDADGILVLTDTFYPGWHAYVDKREEKIYRVNGLVRGVFLKKGKHDIIFKYSPLSFRLGAGISFISLIICFVMVCPLSPLVRLGRGKNETNTSTH